MTTNSLRLVIDGLALNVENLMEYALKYGDGLKADLLEVRGEDIEHATILSEKKEVKTTRVFRRTGIGVRVYTNGATGYSFTTRLSMESVQEAVQRAVKTAAVADRYARLRLKPAEYKPLKERHVIQVKAHPTDIQFEDKKEMLIRGERSAENAGVSVSTTRANYGEACGKKFFLNSEGASLSSDVLLVSMGVSVVSKEGDVIVDASDGHGGSVGLEAFTGEHSPEVFGENAGKWAAEKLRGRKPPAGSFRALIDGRLAGVMAHESFGHMSEYDFVITGGSPLSGKLDQRLGSEHATIVDEGIVDIPGYPGFTLPYDDEGIQTKRTVVLDRGVLKGYLHMRGTAGTVGAEPTGNGRAVDYRFEPICRMRNTYFTQGDLTVDEALELLGKGVYACSTVGGQASIEGTFMFKAVRGYWVEGGEPKYAFRDVAITGHILDFLKNVRGRCRDLKVYSGYFGGCGKAMQGPLPVGLGGPHILLEEAVFGGERR